jgi:hypothetical protein
VGPFWFEKVGESFTFADETVSVRHSDIYENMKDPDAFPNRGRKVDHASLWGQVTRKFPHWSEKKFYEVPRGRVILKEYDKFIVFLSKKFVGDESLKDAIREQFNLPQGSTIFMISPEYKI